MPTYKYRCQKCGEFLVQHKMDEKLYHCPECGKKVERLFCKPNFILKEGDFYSKSP